MLTADLSRAILKITETDESSSIQNKWFNQVQTTCSSEGSQITSEQIGFDSFKGLFGITGSVSGLCCVIALIIFYVKNKNGLRKIVANNSWRTSLNKIWKLFYKPADNNKKPTDKTQN
jgi:glutamate receptor, ionotropic, plant